MKKKFMLFLILSAVLPGLTQSFACAETETEPVSTTAIVDGYNRLGIDLFLRESATAGEGNIFLSRQRFSLPRHGL